MPVLAASVVTLVRHLARSSWPRGSELYFLIGAAAYGLFHIALHRPILAYVLAHETTHALWALFFGGRVRRFRVSSKGGQVQLTHSNFLITLAPYFFPLYALLALTAYGVAVAVTTSKIVTTVLVLLLGAGWAFHALLTFDTVRLRQPDILSIGRVFSYAFISVVNVVILVCILSAISDEISLSGYLHDVVDETREFLVAISRFAMGAYRYFAGP